MARTRKPLWVWIVASGAGVLLAGFILLAVIVFPPMFTHKTADMKRSEVLKAENDVRTALLTAIAGGLFIVTGLFTWRQIQVTREGQITDRFSKAIEQLGRRAKESEPDPLDVRLGGIYALERIAFDSDADRLPVFEVLAAFIREHSPVISMDAAAVPLEDQPDPPSDVVAAASVLRRRKWKRDDLVLDLRRSNLRRMDLRRMRLGGASLTDANLSRTYLRGADLRSAHLARANLTDADLAADLTTTPPIRTRLTAADLTGAILAEAKLGGADVRRAYLSGAVLTGAKLSDADLSGADLSGADLTGATLLRTKLRRTVYDDETMWPEGFEPPSSAIRIAVAR
jgi:hypothetical protein